MASVRNVVKKEAMPLMAKNFADSLKGTEFEGRLPEYNAGNVREWGGVLNTYQPIMNRFFNNVVNKIAFSKCEHMYYNSPYSFAKRGNIPVGMTMELLWFNLAKPHILRKDVDDWAMLKREYPTLASAYVNRNREEFYKQTMNPNLMASMVLSESGLSNMIDEVTSNMHSSNEMDEMLIIGDMIAEAYEHNQVKTVKVESPATRDLSDAMLVSIMTESGNLTATPSADYNYGGVISTTRESDQVLLLTSSANAATSVRSLAYMITSQLGDFNGRKILIPPIPGHPEIQAILCDIEWINIYNNWYESRAWQNDETLDYNYWLHVGQTIFLHPFRNAVIFTLGDVVDYTRVTITPEASTYRTGELHKPIALNIATTPAGGYVNVAVKGNVVPGTRLISYNDKTGIKYAVDISPEETGTLTVIAVVAGDRTVKAETTITPEA